MTSISELSGVASTRPIVLTLGDPCGIGPEIVARAWSQAPDLTRGCFVAGDVGVMRRAMALLQRLSVRARTACGFAPNPNSFVQRLTP